ncbi:MAG TPA: ATP-binding protein, partial [Candidatus Hydrogenedentes bacterium]|nr:ATP-binding protein [Candidatus Hydrogenedentota bacterium]
VRGRICREGDQVVLEVADNGVGIPEESRDKVFDRFYRVHREGEVVPGTGLGLFIVREMVGLHRGRLAVESEPGKGSVFRVFLPAGDPANSP